MQSPPGGSSSSETPSPSSEPRPDQSSHSKVPPRQGEPSSLAVEVVGSSEAIYRMVADEIVWSVQQAKQQQRPCVLGLATGSTMIGVYRQLVMSCQQSGLSLAHVHTFNLDEYWPLASDHAQSYHAFMHEHLFQHVDIDPKNTHLPDGTVTEVAAADHAAEYERRIAELGGLDLQLLGIGRNGHIGFNEPGSEPSSRTRLVTLAEATRNDAAKDWGGLEHVPLRALTMGVATILSARRIVLVALGSKKRTILRQAVQGTVSREVPASFLRRHPNVRILADREAGEFA